MPESDGMLETQAEPLEEQILKLPDTAGLQLMRNVCARLSVDRLHDLYSKVGEMVYRDPVRSLPTELVLAIFSYLSPRDLLTALLISRAWREQAQDEQLWQGCFRREGWAVDRRKTVIQEDLATKEGAQVAECIMRTRRPGASGERRASRKRPYDAAFGENASTDSNARSLMDEEQAEMSSEVDEVQGVGSSITTTTRYHGFAVPETITTAADNSMDFVVPFATTPPPGRPFETQGSVRISPDVFSTAKEPKLSWWYLYKQRRKLERNWETGTYTTFRLPDPSHEDEGHTACVYTFQQSGNWLVSGSRDTSIRVWDLSRYRLNIEPLLGHEQSVLCLQFDAEPDEKKDIIISGGADASVIIWKFSTGQLVKRIDNAHDGSVLNLNFDDRRLVTCSNDTSIKVWNRHVISADDKTVIPACVINDIMGDPKYTGGLDPFTLLNTMTGHQAAVNTVQIRGDIVVSGSGDRTIKSWDLKQDNSPQKTFSGHARGVACIDFDGRRIVSSSADNSVRVFDYDTTAGVACLDGHNNLVRTVQARFGDVQTIRDSRPLGEVREAEESDSETLDGLLPPQRASRGRESHITEITRPKDVPGYQMKLPRAGGGNQWAKIVSGSYDGTIIVWKYNTNGKWRPSQRLDVGMLLSSSDSALPERANTNNTNIRTVNPQQLSPSQQARNLLDQAQTQLLPVSTILRYPPVGHTQALATSQRTTAAAYRDNLNQQMQDIASHQHRHPQASYQAPSVHGHDNHQQQRNRQQAARGAQRIRDESNRVFKVQFDARRVIACSQRTVIIGWDFAAGDRDLEWTGDWSADSA